MSQSESKRMIKILFSDITRESIQYQFIDIISFLNSLEPDTNLVSKSGSGPKKVLLLKSMNIEYHYINDWNIYKGEFSESRIRYLRQHFKTFPVHPLLEV